jgi:hypothetical protein
LILECKAVRAIVVAAIAVMALAEVAGCASYLSYGASQALAAVRVGMTREEVVKQLGEPHGQEMVGTTELLTYRPDWTVTPALAQNPIAITEGKVAGVGPTYALKLKQEFRAANASIK